MRNFAHDVFIIKKGEIGKLAVHLTEVDYTIRYYLAQPSSYTGRVVESGWREELPEDDTEKK